MKKVLRALGVLLMVFGGIGFFSLLVTIPKALFSQTEDRLGLLVSLLLLLAVMAGLFWLGRALFLRSGGGRRTAGRGQSLSAERESAPVSAKTTAAADRGSPVSSLRMRNDDVILYQDPDAERDVLRTGLPALSDFRAVFHENVPCLDACTYEAESSGKGKAGVTMIRESLEIPRELRATLTPKTLRDWLYTGEKDWPVVWSDPALLGRLNSWCCLVQEREALKLPDCVYAVSAPFPCLDDIGPDGLEDASGVAQWLRMKSGAAVSEVIRSLTGTEQTMTRFVLTEDPLLLAGLSSEELMLCTQHGLCFGLLTAPDRIRNLVDGREYRVESHEWPGSADDAATYGSWKLTELPAPKVQEPPAEDAMLDDVSYIQDMKHSTAGAWQQYDVLLAARGYGWATMVDWADYMASADLDQVGTLIVSEIANAPEQELIGAFRSSGGRLRDFDGLTYERGTLAIGGISRTLKAPVKIVWFNQTRVLRFFTPVSDDALLTKYIETVIRRSFGTADAMKTARRADG